MNRQKEIVITVTYNELGIIVDTKAEPRKKGKWIDDYDPMKFGEFRYKCSKCGARTVEWADNFCFNCGADMRGEQDD